MAEPQNDEHQDDLPEVTDTEVTATTDEGSDTADDASFSAAAPDHSSVAKQPKSGRGIALLALLAGLAGIGSSAYNWYEAQQNAAVTAPEPIEIPDFGSQIERSANALGARIDAVAGDVDRALAGVERQGAEMNRISGSRASLEADLQRVGDTAQRQVTALERRFTVIEGSVATLADMQAGAVKAMGVAETEFLLRLANERMQLFDDPRSALRALRLADAQLRALEDPVYDAVRQSLAGEIQALEDTELPDRVAISGRLLSLAQGSTDWPLDARRSLRESSANLLEQVEAPAADEPQSWWGKARANAARAASKVATVHRIEASDPVLISLDQERLLRENVRLQLQVAQLAAVRGEQTLYGKSINAVEAWLNEYYAVESKPVADALATLDELGREDLQPRLPDIAGSLRQLRNLRAAVDLSEQAPTQAGEQP